MNNHESAQVHNEDGITGWRNINEGLPGLKGGGAGGGEEMRALKSHALNRVVSLNTTAQMTGDILIKE